MWREVVRDGARTGGGEAGPSPLPLSQRLAFFRPGPTQKNEVLESLDTLVSDAPPSVKAGGGEGGREKRAENESDGDLRLNDRGGKPEGLAADSSSPTRGPPKTPKRNKVSSPQLSDVSVDILSSSEKAVLLKCTVRSYLIEVAFT